MKNTVTLVLGLILLFTLPPMGIFVLWLIVKEEKARK